MVTPRTQEGIRLKLPGTPNQSPAGVVLNLNPLETGARTNHSFHLELTHSPPAQTHNTHTHTLELLLSLK